MRYDIHTTFCALHYFGFHCSLLCNQAWSHMWPARPARLQQRASFPAAALVQGLQKTTPPILTVRGSGPSPKSKPPGKLEVLPLEANLRTFWWLPRLGQRGGQRECAWPGPGSRRTGARLLLGCRFRTSCSMPTGPGASRARCPPSSRRGARPRHLGATPA